MYLIGELWYVPCCLMLCNVRVQLDTHNRVLNSRNISKIHVRSFPHVFFHSTLINILCNHRIYTCTFKRRHWREKERKKSFRWETWFVYFCSFNIEWQSVCTVVLIDIRSTPTTNYCCLPFLHSNCRIIFSFSVLRLLYS